MNTTENNKIIAEFMGWKMNSPSTFPIQLHQEEETQGNWKLLFHSDWNWLMEVILKINQFDNQRFSVLISSMDCKINDNLKNKIVSDSFGRFNPDELKESIYKAVVEFIKWYNNQKN